MPTCYHGLSLVRGRGQRCHVRPGPTAWFIGQTFFTEETTRPANLAQISSVAARAPLGSNSREHRWSVFAVENGVWTVGLGSAIHGKSGSTPQSTRRGIRCTALDHLRAGLMSTRRQVTRDDLRSPTPEHLFYIFPTARLGFSRPRAVTADFFQNLPLGGRILYTTRQAVRDCKLSPPHHRVLDSNPDLDRHSDHSQNLMNCSLARDTPVVKVPCESVNYYVSYLAWQTNKQYDRKHNLF